LAVTCTCGRSFRAPDSLRGRTAKCPACGGPIQIPPAQPAEVDLFSIDPLMAADPFAAKPASADPLAGGNPLQPSALGRPAAQSKSGETNWLLIGIGGGGAALALIVIVVIFVATSGGGSEVADVPDQPTGPPSTAPATSTPSSSATSSNSAATPAVSPTPSTSSSVPRSDSPPALPGLSSTPAAIASAANSASPETKAPSGPVKPSGRHVLAELPGGVHAWHNESRGKLVGIFNLKEDQNPIAQLSWMTSLLPHLGYQKHYDMLVRDKPITEKANLQVGVQTIPEFLNPIEGTSRWTGYPFDGLAVTHFAGMAGVEDARNVCAGQLPRSDPRAGIFGYDEVAKPADITDGTSQTVMIVGSGPLASPWIMGGGSTIRGYREPLFDPISGLGMRGLPNGGTVVVMADGSVRQIPANIDPKVFRAMCTMHGAETVDLGPVPTFNLEDWK
jgi:hypothetical protein